MAGSFSSMAAKLAELGFVAIWSIVFAPTSGSAHGFVCKAELPAI
eukprot:CAMPEP_0172927214 /NCGR_PEP_ID=MMETSP1075-20121228/217100_1 /TAXON_ID=2916 /ORGANISM="Ceratium fusus, Strain PA161109" /LENGTH=44 /DNA_ID= /DNA_START= /DNA_END= /DNA_ORIENTATION=